MKKAHPFLKRNLINLILFEELLADNFGLLWTRLDVVRTGLDENELAVKLVQVVNLHAQGKSERNEMSKFTVSLCRADKSFNTYRLVPIFCGTIFEINYVFEIVHLYTEK